MNLNSNFVVVAVVTGIPAGCASRFLAVYRPGIPVYRPVLPVYRLFRAVFRRLKKDPRCEIKGNFGISYAHFNVNDLTKAIIYNHAYNTIVISVHTNTESYTYTHEMKVQRRNGKTPIWDAVWYSAVDIKAKSRTLSSSAF